MNGTLPFTRISVRSRDDGAPENLQYVIIQYRNGASVKPFGFNCPQE